MASKTGGLLRNSHSIDRMNDVINPTSSVDNDSRRCETIRGYILNPLILTRLVNGIPYFINSEEAPLVDEIKTEFLDKGILLADSNFALSPSGRIPRRIPISVLTHRVNSAPARTSSVI
jgi:hypothetical protein